jgi:bacterioferritin-associated ferredoxin
MYICICKAVTDSQIRSAVRDGITSMSGLRATLGCTGQCGKCGRHVKQVRDDSLREMNAEVCDRLIPVFAPA